MTRPPTRRPRVERLEDRLPPGDAALSAALGPAWLGAPLIPDALDAAPAPAATAPRQTAARLSRWLTAADQATEARHPAAPPVSEMAFVAAPGFSPFAGAPAPARGAGGALDAAANAAAPLAPTPGDLTAALTLRTSPHGGDGAHAVGRALAELANLHPQQTAVPEGVSALDVSGGSCEGGSQVLTVDAGQPIAQAVDPAEALRALRSGSGSGGQIMGACPDGLPDGTTCLADQDDNGAHYLVAIPEDWNGNLFLFAHGGPRWTEPEPLVTTDLFQSALLLSQGHAVGASSYRGTGYNVSRDAEDTENLRQLFVAAVGQPTRTVVIGVSYGGPVAAKVVEYYGVAPDGSRNYDGGLLYCGVVAGSRRIGYEFLDIRVVYQYYCNNHPRPDEPQYPLWMGLHPDSTYSEPDLQARANQCTGILLPADQRTPEQQRILTNILNVISIPENELTIHLGALGTRHVRDISQRVLGGRNPFPNHDVWYSGSDDDAALNKGVLRYRASPAGVAQLILDTEPTGEIDIPVVTQHAIGDHRVFVEQETAYRDAVAYSGRLDNLFQTYVNATGHCGMSSAEYGGSIDALLTWIDTQEKPTQDDVIANCQRYSALGFGACRVAPTYEPAPFESRVPGRSPW